MDIFDMKAKITFVNRDEIIETLDKIEARANDVQKQLNEISELTKNLGGKPIELKVDII